jgi:glycosyltransferase involved in cell wall biosynthesis
MKICYFSCSSIYGGVEKIVVDSLNEISKNHECALIVPFGCRYKDKLSSNVKIIEYKSYDKRYNPFLYLEVLKVIKNYDIVHTHGAKATQITYLLNKIIPFIHVATKHNTRKGKIFNKVKNVISVSSEVAKTITHPSKVLYFGIKKTLNLESKKNNIFTMIAVGRLDPIKGFDRLIEQVSKLDFDFVLNIIGEGSQKAKLQELISSKNLEKKVLLLGFKDDIPQYLVNSHLQVISSLTEGLPLTLLEGILNSSLIISTPVGGIVEVLDGDYLLKIEEFPNKITDIYKDYEKYCKDFKLKHELLKQKFDFDDYSKSLVKYYEGCINAKTL